MDDKKRGIALLLAVVASAFIGAILGRKVKAAPVGRRPPCGNYGDIDGDGYVTQQDADLVGRYVLGEITLSSEQLLRADVSGDGQVDIGDASFIAQYVDRVMDTFLVCLLPPPEEFPGSSPWSFSNFSAQVVPWTEPVVGTLLFFMTYRIIITNKGSAPATKTVSLYMRWWDDIWRLVESREVTLLPLEQYEFVSEPWYKYPSRLQVLTGYVHHLQFRTSDGELSNILSVSV